ncbi:MAG: ABC transporter transmembrane domain-containing protein, partial [Sphingomonadales bacterium]
MSDQESESENKAPEGLKRLGALRFVAGYVRPYKGLLAGALTALVVAAAATLGIFQSLGLIVDNGFAVEDSAAIDKYFLGLLVVILVLSVSTYFRFKLVTILGERVVADIRKGVHGHLIGLNPSFFEENRPSEIASRLTADTTLIQSVVGSSASIALRNILMFMGGTVMLLLISPKLLGLMTLVVPVVIAPMVLIGRRVRSLSRTSQDRVAEIGAMANQALDAIQTVQAFTREEEERGRFTSAVEEAFQAARHRISVRAIMSATVIVLVFGAIDLILWTGATDVISGAMTGGQMASFVGLSIIVAGAVGALSEVYGDLQRAAGASERLAELMAVETTLPVIKNPLPIPHPASGEVEFSGVSFSYPSKPDIKALDDFSLKMAAGETVALVGPSGAGKSTVLQLLLRFFDPQEGTVSIDGVDLRKADPLAVRSQMAIVPQETMIFADSVTGNVRYGRLDASDDEVSEALRAAQCEEFVKALPEGALSFLGEKGVRLSGGQRQRLAIARAILRDAPVLLLDEATSALDSEAERKVQSALEALMQNRTTLVIAHRLSTV